MTQPSLNFEQPATRHVRRLTPVAKETIRRQSNKARVLARLEQGPATTMDLIAVGGARAVARTWELRKQGHAMTIDDLGGGLFRYTLIGRA